MHICVKCGMLLCSETSPLSAELTKGIVHDPNFGTALLDPEFKLVLHIGQTSLLMLFPHHSQLTLGRGKGTVTDTMLDPAKVEQASGKYTPIVLDHMLSFLDLEPYGGTATGVSRKHARIDNQGDILTITDLNSTNGTRLNGDLLRAGVKRILRDNDVITLGVLKIKLVFYQDNLDVEPEMNLLLKAEAEAKPEQAVTPSLDPAPTLPVRPDGFNELVQAAVAEVKATSEIPAEAVTVKPETLEGTVPAAAPDLKAETNLPDKA
jgi:pSer/pThr/pTyr-binding forkhead associated (FHA) protein